MKKTALLLLNIFLVFSYTTTQAQDFSKSDITFLKYLRKSIYQKLYVPDSLISKTIDPETAFPWQGQTFKNSSSIIDSIHATMKSEKSSENFSLYGLFPKGIPQQDCNLFTSKLVSYNLVNEKGEQVQLRNEKFYFYTGQYYRNNDAVRYTFNIRFTPFIPAKTYKGIVEYEIIAPKDFIVTAITKADIGKTITLNSHVYTILAFTKNYIALKCPDSLKEIDFDFIGTDLANKKYKQKFTQEKGYKTALGKRSFFISEEMYKYYISHPGLTEEELDQYMNDYFNRHEGSIITGEAQVLILQDIAYIKKMFCYWPNGYTTKRFKETIDLKY
ncbi:hypothetical protein [Cytophaga hutchinsonii]|uniref:YARHG domain-containing protein n=1 Tax=Cytophaga hutchinsonii (strain ATCC 33406 / DSM 1761 / CIP 103989 / NBRC 15051 / NCIMB 9469 / D465) TaxID=269798 RepID=A0A6N4SMP2_CYTH3|nr:hypothetical protein [Cytophaga hutchinsonii]ABG57541.1 hypothetical protein CHU_0249 [Cytophaga hutchinsonii ATCC 33406]SFW99544.1 hypothetical protein SAMN04487930_101103 [Cytophaga hutchinsonii ATCC 33406]